MANGYEDLTPKEELHDTIKELREQIKELEVEIIKHRKGRLDALELISQYDQKWGEDKLLLKKRIKELEAENDKLNDALVRIDNWAKAYPLDVFPKPDLKQAARVLKAAGMTLDAISADAMRHVIDSVKDIVGRALKPEGK